MALKHHLDVILETAKQCASIEEAADLLDITPHYLRGLMREHAPAHLPKAKIGRKKAITDIAAAVADYSKHGYASWTANTFGVSAQTVINMLREQAPELLEKRSALREQVERTYKVSVSVQGAPA